MMRKIFKNIAMICLAICVAIGSFFVPVTKKQSYNYVSADNTNYSITFNGSGLWLPISRTTEQSTNYVDYLLADINFSINRLTYEFEFNFNGTSGFYSANEWSYGGLNYNYFVFDGLYDYSGSLDSTSLGNIFGVSNVQKHGLATYYDGNGFCNFAIKGSDNIISSDIIGVRVGFVDTVDTNFDYPCNYISYFDADNNFVTFYFVTITGSSTVNMLSNRVYYFDDAFNLSDNQIYNQGYYNGLADNQQNVYDNGYNDGYDIGFDRGRINGVAESNNYSFLGLIGAVVDAPVSILSSLFNFTFLGINLWSFITSLLTIALILFVVKIFMRR